LRAPRTGSRWSVPPPDDHRMRDEPEERVLTEPDQLRAVAVEPGRTARGRHDPRGPRRRESPIHCTRTASRHAAPAPLSFAPQPHTAEADGRARTHGIDG